jgi:hypothetical protein
MRATLTCAAGATHEAAESGYFAANCTTIQQGALSFDELDGLDAEFAIEALEAA